MAQKAHERHYLPSSRLWFPRSKPQGSVRTLLEMHGWRWQSRSNFQYPSKMTLGNTPLSQSASTFVGQNPSLFSRNTASAAVPIEARAAGSASQSESGDEKISPKPATTNSPLGKIGTPFVFPAPIFENSPHQLDRSSRSRFFNNTDNGLRANACPSQPFYQEEDSSREDEHNLRRSHRIP